jgi:hypothetical protein
MQIPVKITYRHLPPSEFMEALVRLSAARLGHRFPRIVDCHVVVEATRRPGRELRVRVGVSVPGEEVVADGETIRSAFRAVRRELEDGDERRRDLRRSG